MTTRSSLLLSLGLSLALAAGAAAGTGKSGHKGGMKTLTGCLEKGDDAGTFKLTHVAGSTRDWEIAEAAASLKLSEHVGHKVEVSGTMMSTAAAAKAEGTTVKSEAAEHARHLKVTSMKHVAATCP